MTTDETVLGGLLDRIALETTNLRRLAGMSQTELHADPDRLYGVKHRFVVAIEASIDASRHLALARHLRSAGSFADAFVVLGEADVLSADLVSRLAGMAKFRSLLVHGYADVDDGRVIEILKNDLDDLDEFRRRRGTVTAGRPDGDSRRTAAAQRSRRISRSTLGSSVTMPSTPRPMCSRIRRPALIV